MNQDVGPFSRDLTINKVPAKQGLYLGFANEKINISAILWPQGEHANDMCIITGPAKMI